METESESTSTATAPANPYLRALLILAGITLAMAAILGLTAASLHDAGQELGDILVWASVFGVIGLFTFLLWLLGMAASWKPSTSRVAESNAQETF